MKVFRPARRLLFVAFLSMAACSPQAAEPVAPSVEGKAVWLTNYAEAQGEAKARQKLLLLDFTGSDWCGWCMKLKREVFNTPEFAAYARKHLVLLEVDFPRGRELAEAQKVQNQLLAQELGVRGFPTIVIMNAEGRVLGALGYAPGGPAPFLSALEKLRQG